MSIEGGSLEREGGREGGGGREGERERVKKERYFSINVTSQTPKSPPLTTPTNHTHSPLLFSEHMAEE